MGLLVGRQGRGAHTLGQRLRRVAEHELEAAGEADAEEVEGDLDVALLVLQDAPQRNGPNAPTAPAQKLAMVAGASQKHFFFGGVYLSFFLGRPVR